jgi:hypothetical protein
MPKMHERPDAEWTMWGLKHSYTVFEAAALIVDMLPNSELRYFFRNDYLDDHAPALFSASFNAIKGAIEDEKLKARIVRRAEFVMQDRLKIISDGSFGGVAVQGLPGGDVRGMLSFFISNANIRTNFLPDDHPDREVIISKEPDWDKTTILRSDIVDWLKQGAARPEFFFPLSAEEGLWDKSHPRYSPKLACAVAAWEEYARNLPSASVKKTVDQWVRENGQRFAPSDGEAFPSDHAVKQIAAVVNWDVTGGAPKTGGSASDPSQAHQPRNYSPVALATSDKEKEPRRK